MAEEALSDPDAAPIDLTTTKDALANEILQHYKDLETFAPALVSVDLTTANPLTDRVLLPSKYTKEQRRSFNLTGLAEIERRLRIGRAHDALEGLRRGLGLVGILTRQMKIDTDGLNTSGAPQTRAWKTIKRAKDVIKYWTQTYRRCWESLEKLEGSTADLCGLRPLLEEDSSMLSTWLQEDKFLRNTKSLPWIWMVSELSKDGETQEAVDRAITEWNSERKHC